MKQLLLCWICPWRHTTRAQPSHLLTDWVNTLKHAGLSRYRRHSVQRLASQLFTRGFGHRHISSTVDQNVYFTQFLLAVITWVISSQKQRSDKSQYCRCKLGQSLWAQTKLCSEVPIICWRINTIMWRHRAEMEPSNTCIASTYVTRMLLKESLTIGEFVSVPKLATLYQ